MSKSYRLWIVIEEHDEKTDEYRDLEMYPDGVEPRMAGPKLDSLKEAEALALEIEKAYQ